MSFNLKNRHFLTIHDFTPKEILYLLDLARDLKRAKYAGTEVKRLGGKNVGDVIRQQPGGHEARVKWLKPDSRPRRPAPARPVAARPACAPAIAPFTIISIARNCAWTRARGRFDL